MGVRGGFGDRGAMMPSEVFLREGLSLGMLPSKENTENIDLIREVRG